MKQIRVAADSPRRAFTLVELLVVIAIIGVLVGLLFPAVQSAREAARRSTCTNQLRQQIVALENYESAERHFPPGALKHKSLGQTGISWRVLILPYLEEQPLYALIAPDFSTGGWAKDGAMPELFKCPSVDRDISQAEMPNYGGVAGARREGQGLTLEEHTCGHLYQNGVLFPDSWTRVAEITDGTSKTLAIGERTYLFEPWMVGSQWFGPPDDISRYCSYAATHVAYPINASLDTFGYFVGHNPPPPGAVRSMLTNDLLYGSYHPGAAHFAYADGSVRLLHDDLDITIFKSLATINGEETTD